MLTATISALDRDSVVSDEHYEWLLRHMYEPLEVLCLNFMHETGELFSISIAKPAPEVKYGFDVITIFMLNYRSAIKIEGDLPWK